MFQTDTQALIKKRPEPSLAPVGNQRAIATDGRVHPGLIRQLLDAQAWSKWFELKPLARQTAGSVNKATCQRVVRHLHKIRRDALERDQVLLLFDYKGRSIAAVKWLDWDSEQDRQIANEQLGRMRDRAEITAAQYQQALDAIKARATLATKDD